MLRTVIRIILTISVVIMFCMPGYSIAQSAKRLLTINDVEYTDEEFRNWWKHWNDKNEIKSPVSPEEFIVFQLMAQQGLAMGYDTHPEYLHKLDVFLQVRAMMALKYEEVDSRVVVTDSDLRNYFNENYATTWTIQILTFNSEDKAKKAYEAMLPYKGQVAGRLAFADLHGGDDADKAEAYDEVKVSAADFYKSKRASWLPLVKKLADNDVSYPFMSDDSTKYILIRLVESKPAAEGVFEEKRRKMTEVLNKEKRNQLTVNLIESLKKKYNVNIDRQLFDSVKLDIDYPKEFLEQKLIVMNDYSATVLDLIYNAKKEKNIRKGVGDEIIKDMVLNSFISQTLIKKESLARGYEKRPPLFWTFEFYKQSRLRAEVESGLMNSIVPSEHDINEYYISNIAAFTVPERLTFFLLEGENEVLQKIWLGLLQGGDFIELAKKYSLESPRQSVDIGALSPVVVEQINKLEKGNVSQPFVFNGKYALVKLLDRTPGQVSSLEQVKNQVVEQFKNKKFELVKAEYIGKLKSKSKIDINERVWKGLVRELSNAKKD